MGLRLYLQRRYRYHADDTTYRESNELVAEYADATSETTILADATFHARNQTDGRQDLNLCWID